MLIQPPPEFTASPAIVHRNITSTPDVWRLYAAAADEDDDLTAG